MNLAYLIAFIYWNVKSQKKEVRVQVPELLRDYWVVHS